MKLTSPNLNYFLIAGTYIMYAAVFLQLISSTMNEFNYARCIVSHLVVGILHMHAKCFRDFDIVYNYAAQLHVYGYSAYIQCVWLIRSSCSMLYVDY